MASTSPIPEPGNSGKASHAFSAWERVQLARHGKRPRMLDYVDQLFDDFIELHGDRVYADDPAMVCGLARFRGLPVAVVGQQKGASTDEKIRRNFGMARPWGYRKALRLYRMAERLRLPVVSLVDTPAADPGVESEQHGQGFGIGQMLLAATGLRTPLFAAILSEGGSGGALAIAAADWVCMFENAVYVICPPERCAEILWRDVNKRELAASAMKVTAADLLDMGVIDHIMPEPAGGAHLDPAGAARNLGGEIERFLAGCREGAWSLARRQERFRRAGLWAEGPSEAGGCGASGSRGE